MTLVVQLVDYQTNVAKAYSDFYVDVLPILDTWVPPPPNPPSEEKE